MQKTKKKLRFVKEVSDVLCNCCGRSCKVRWAEIDLYEYAKIDVVWGYGSEHDGEEHLVHLCAPCFFKITENFKLPTRRDQNE